MRLIQRMGVLVITRGSWGGWTAVQQLAEWNATPEMVIRRAEREGLADLLAQNT